VTELTKKATEATSGRNTPSTIESKNRSSKPSQLLSNQSWTQQSNSLGKSLRYDEVHTNQVHDTIQEFGKKTAESGRSTTPAPTRNIGEGFADGKVCEPPPKNVNEEPVSISKVKQASWRTGASNVHEPTLKLVNVSVEKPANVHISENAQAQISSFMQQDVKKESKTTTSSSITFSSASMSTEVKKDSFQFTDSFEEQKVVQVPPKSPGPAKKEKAKVTHPESVISSTKQAGKRHVEITEIASIQHNEMKSSTQIGQIPMPVSQQWFDTPPHGQQQQQVYQKQTQQSHFQKQVHHLHQDQQNKREVNGSKLMPLPVLASWFDESEKLSNQVEVKKQSTPEKSVSQIAESEGKVVNNTTKKSYIQRATFQESDENSAKNQRAKELEEMLRARNESGGGRSSEMDDPERIFAKRQRDERERELQEVAQLRATSTGQNVWEETDAHERAEISRLQRAREIQEIAQSRQKLKWDDVVSQANKQPLIMDESQGDAPTGKINIQRTEG